MKMNIGLFGVETYFDSLSESKRTKGFSAICDSFVQVTADDFSAIVKDKPTDLVLIRGSIIPRHCFADIEIIRDKDDGRVFIEVEFKFMGDRIRELWLEYVRTFIDSGCSVGVRIKFGNQQRLWPTPA